MYSKDQNSSPRTINFFKIQGVAWIIDNLVLDDNNDNDDDDANKGRFCQTSLSIISDWEKHKTRLSNLPNSWPYSSHYDETTLAKLGADFGRGNAESSKGYLCLSRSWRGSELLSEAKKETKQRSRGWKVEWILRQPLLEWRIVMLNFWSNSAKWWL